ncbi:MAG: DUF2793 domain-containing protein [Pseudomonadota bacterium]
MSETANLALPLVQASQAQKHVTVNEALIRLDAAAQLVLEAVDLDTPPVTVVDGACYGIGTVPTDDWVGHAGQVAVGDNGGWSFFDPRRGWRAWNAGSGRALVWSGAGWRREGLDAAASGASARFETIEILHTISAGPENTTAMVIPAGVTLFAASARVVTAITGAASTWRLGEAGATDRFGSGLGLGAGSFGTGLLGQPQGYYTPSPLVITGEGGDLAGGAVRLALHYIAFDLPGG